MVNGTRKRMAHAHAPDADAVHPTSNVTRVLRRDRFFLVSSAAFSSAASASFTRSLAFLSWERRKETVEDAAGERGRLRRLRRLVRLVRLPREAAESRRCMAHKICVRYYTQQKKIELVKVRENCCFLIQTC